jgi:RHS repeat-associated protein
MQVYPDATSELSTYDAEGRRLTSTDRAGRATTFEYDELGRLTKTILVDGSLTTTDYDPIGRVTASTDAHGNATRYEYDNANRRTKVIDALNHETTFAYDTNGNQASMTDARSNTVSYEYDVLNRQTKMVYADSTFSTTTFDGLGRATAKSDQAGKTTQFEFDRLGRLTKVTDALNQQTRYSFDELGNQRTQTDANNHTTSFEYDKLGRRIKRTLPLGMFEAYSYNAAGNLLTRKDFNGKTTTYAYDSTNRLLSKTPDASFAAAPITFTYTLTGRRASMTDPSGTTTNSYDLRDRLTSKATPQGTLSYSYDSGGNLLTMRSSNTNGAAVDYSYDELNRLSMVTDLGSATPSITNSRPGTGSTSYSYDAVGNLGSSSYPSGVTHAYTYNTLNRLTNVTITNAATTSLASFTYTLGVAGNRLSVTELNGRQATYTYDDLYRLTNETISFDPLVANNGSIDYVYDRVGNRQSLSSTLASVPSSSSTYDANDRLTSDSYDANGSTTTSRSNTYRYDFENRLIVLNPGAPNAATFAYDGDGNRVAKTVGGVTTKFLVDDNKHTGYTQVVEESVSSNVERLYVYGHSLISQTQLINNNWASAFYAYDGHGSGRFLIDVSGVVTDTHTFDAFGNLIATTGTTPHNFLYGGEQFDSNLGFYYLRARYMDPSRGRFWTIDKFDGEDSDPPTLHKYLYANADPINKIDPSGEFSIVEIGAANLIRMELSDFIGGIGIDVIDSLRDETGISLDNLIFGAGEHPEGVTLAGAAGRLLSGAQRAARRALLGAVRAATKSLDAAKRLEGQVARRYKHVLVDFDAPRYRPDGTTLTRYDVELKNAIIEVTKGDGGDKVRQLSKNILPAAKLDNKLVFLYCPNCISRPRNKEIEKLGVRVIRDLQELDLVVKSLHP